MSFISNGISWLHDQQQIHATEIITYVRDDLSVEFSAVVGRKTFREEDYDSGVLIRTQTSDFTITAALLRAQFGDPQEGDKITHFRNGDTRLYEVKSPLGRPCFQRVNQDLDLRIHSQEIDGTVVMNFNYFTDDAKTKAYYADDAKTKRLVLQKRV